MVLAFKSKSRGSCKAYFSYYFFCIKIHCSVIFSFHKKCLRHSKKFGKKLQWSLRSGSIENTGSHPIGALICMTAKTNDQSIFSVNFSKSKTFQLEGFHRLYTTVCLSSKSSAFYYKFLLSFQWLRQLTDKRINSRSPEDFAHQESTEITDKFKDSIVANFPPHVSFIGQTEIP